MNKLAGEIVGLAMRLLQRFSSLGVLVTMGLTAPAQALEVSTEGSVQTVVMEVGELYAFEVDGVSTYAHHTPDDATELSFAAAQMMQLRGARPGRSVLVLNQPSGPSRLIAVEVKASARGHVPSAATAGATPAVEVAPLGPNAKPNAPSPHGKRVRALAKQGKLTEARDLLLPVVRAGGTREDATTLRALCIQLRDDGCQQVVEARLRSFASASRD